MIDSTLFSIENLIKILLDVDWSQPGNHWRLDCEIIRDWIPPYPKSDTRPCVVVKHIPSGNYLRYSKGPRQGFGWDTMPDDMINPELALIGLSRAPPPPFVILRNQLGTTGTT